MLITFVKQNEHPNTAITKWAFSSRSLKLFAMKLSRKTWGYDISQTRYCSQIAKLTIVSDAGHAIHKGG